MSTASIVARAELGRADGEDARAAAVVEHARAAHRLGRAVAIQRRHMRVVGWVPVPKARPGSSRISVLAAAGGSCQLGTIQKLGRDLDRRELRLRQAHPVLRRARRCSACTCTPAAQSCASSSVAARWRRPRRRTARSAPSAASRRAAPACRARRTAPARRRCRRRRPRPTRAAPRASISASLRLDRDSRRAGPVRSSAGRRAVQGRLRPHGGSARCWGLIACARAASLRGSGCWCRPRRTWRRPSARGAAGCWSGCPRPPSPTARCACAPAPARACRRAR